MIKEEQILAEKGPVIFKVVRLYTNAGKKKPVDRFYILVNGVRPLKKHKLPGKLAMLYKSAKLELPYDTGQILMALLLFGGYELKTEVDEARVLANKFHFCIKTPIAPINRGAHTYLNELNGKEIGWDYLFLPCALNRFFGKTFLNKLEESWER